MKDWSPTGSERKSALKDAKRKNPHIGRPRVSTSTGGRRDDRSHWKLRLTLLAAALFATNYRIVSADAAPIDQRGQFMGVDIATELPVGVFASNLTTYGRSDGTKSDLTTDIPVVTWATPFRVLDSEIAVSYSAPFVAQNGPQISNPTAQSRLDAGPQAFGPTIGHTFASGFAVSLSGFVRPPTNYLNNYTATSILLGLAYVKDGWNADATIAYSGTFGGTGGTPNALQALVASGRTSGISGASDGIGIDYTLKKRFGKFQFGVVGFAQTELNRRADDIGFNVVGLTRAGPVLTTYDKRLGVVGVGGLIEYDFSRFTLQGMATREVAKRFAYNGVQGLAGNPGYGEKETRGWLRVIVPLYVAPRAEAPVVARY